MEFIRSYDLIRADLSGIHKIFHKQTVAGSINSVIIPRMVILYYKNGRKITGYTGVRNAAIYAVSVLEEVTVPR